MSNRDGTGPAGKGPRTGRKAGPCKPKKQKGTDMKENSQFKTLRHIETVRNYLNLVIKEFIVRGELHDQSKLQEPELSIFDEFTSRLRGITYGSDEYRECMKKMKPAIDHHNENNRHHPEHFPNGIAGMNLIDLLEMLCDWKAATLRHNDGDIRRSLEINSKRFGFPEGLREILSNTVDWIENQKVQHVAQES